MIKMCIDVEVVEQLMKERCIDNKKMAKLMKVTLPTIRRILKGGDQSYYTVNMVFAIARALNVSIPDIIHKDYRQIVHL